MATECTQEAVVQFLTERGGRAKNQELIDYFKAFFPDDPDQKAIVRDKFKGYVDNVAFVKLENGGKCVCLKKKYRFSLKYTVEKGNGTGTLLEQDISTPVLSKSYKNLIEDCAPQLHLSVSSDGDVRSCETTANEEAQQETSPGSGYGTDNAPGIILEGNIGERAASTWSVVQNNSLSDNMGNALGLGGNGEQKLTKEDIQTLQPHGIPQIAVIEASPLPTAADGSMFHLPGRPFPTNAQDSLLSSQPSSQDGADEGQYYDSQLSVSGSDSNTPKGSRNNFIELMMNSSPQERRSMVLRNSVYLSAKYRDCARSDSDSASVVSSTTDEDSASVTLDPLEHEWMMCASDGQWESLHRLLSCEPNLAMKKDFVTGFTCLHWAAKQGKQELLALIVNFANQHTVPININARSSAGYTPLHLAAMHNHVEVVKLLVGAYDADIEARDYNGKKACQYLTNSVAIDIRDIIGAGGGGDSDSENTDYGDGGRWRLSKVLQSNLMPLKLLNHSEEDTGDGAGQARQKPLQRKSSLSKMKPKLQKIRFRSSQIVHSTSFPAHCETEEFNGSRKGSFKSRPMSNLFG
ncbi:ankyrin repeat domain-containing protein SOWAHC-like [Coregonus clupeaformis]|uniref:ankyrin repeat domain-containing protein SOWAHC-like n=1 Tax=Coregonus clupeaformis TaxID=59861 RepID=UPI001BE0FB1A|nr:ankyrin repeat domain-containing protein SOWAHC-like [Coregonus clupeaformis]